MRGNEWQCWSLGREIAKGSTDEGCKVQKIVPVKPEERLDANSGRRTDPIHPTEGRARHGRGALELKFLPSHCAQ